MRTELLFRIGNQSVSNVSALGLLVAQAVGSMQLTGIMHGFDGDEHVTYGEDAVQVHVRLLSGVRVHTPLTLLDVGTEMMVRAAGLEGESPFAFGSLPALQFDWTVANPDVLQLAHMYAQHPRPRRPHRCPPARSQCARWRCGPAPHTSPSASARVPGTTCLLRVWVWGRRRRPLRPRSLQRHWGERAGLRVWSLQDTAMRALCASCVSVCLRRSSRSRRRRCPPRAGSCTS